MSVFPFPARPADDTDASVDAVLAEEAQLSGPNFRVDQGIYSMAWGRPHFVSIEFDQLRADRDGGLAGEITVRSTARGLERLIHKARVSLTASLTRQTLGKYLRERTAGLDLDWPELVEQAVVKTLEAYRNGDPAIYLRDAQPQMTSRWILPPLLLSQHPTILFGDGGTGKSLFALAAALSIHSGRGDLLGVAPAGQLRVAYLDWEGSAWEHRLRMRNLIGNEPEPDLIYVRCYGALRDQVDRLRRIIRAHQIEFLIIDSAAPAAGGPPEEAQIALGFFDALRELGLGSLVICHETKVSDGLRPFGSAFWHNLARATWNVRNVRQPGSNILNVGLYNRKANSASIALPMGFSITFEGEDEFGRTTVRRTDVAEAAGLAMEMTLSWRMQQALKSGSKTYEDLAEELGSTAEAVRKQAKRHPDRFYTTTDRPAKVTLLLQRAGESHPDPDNVSD